MSEPPSPEPVVCPSCGNPLVIESKLDQPFARCPHCGADFLPDSNEEIEDAAVEWEEPAPPEDELDGPRIRKLVQLRRSAIRARTYAVVVLICCMVMGAQLVLTDIQEVSTYGWDRWAIIYAIAAAVLVIVATIASRKAATLNTRSNMPSENPPQQAPNFESLSDGSQQVRNLEAMVDDKDSVQ